MRENILRLLMELFAIIGEAHPEKALARRKMEEEFLRQTLSLEKAKEFLTLYDTFAEGYHSADSALQDRQTRAAEICAELNRAITQKQKTVVLVRLIQYLFIDPNPATEESAFLQVIQRALRIEDGEFQLLLHLITDIDRFRGLGALITGSEQKTLPEGVKTLLRKELKGKLYFAFVQSADFYFLRYIGNEDLELSGIPIKSDEVYIFSPGAAVRGALINPIYFSDVVDRFLDKELKESITYRVDDITYHFSSGKQGLHPLSFVEKSGSLVGIMGGSGAGKSTLLNVLNGSAPPSAGSVKINGLDLHKQASDLEGVVGFVSQSDLLMEDLTVFQNLYFNAQLCLAELNDEEIRERVDTVLSDLGLIEAKDLRVGSPLDKIISGGQRKRLNIALELIREPGVLFLDEPTSGLSSRDSEVIIDLLKSLALKGKLVFVVIHQPSSQIFKVFDRLLLLDQGGYPVYLGNPVDAIIHFKHATHQINPDIGECNCCGNVNPEQIFSIVEARLLDERGLPTGERRFTAKEWNDYYLEHQATPIPSEQHSADRYENEYRKPGLLAQFSVFVKRDILSKLNNKQYLLITLLEAPVLAFILTFLTRYERPGMEYTFQDNRNLVAYVFMSVIVALFLGLMISAEEIFKDRKILKRERFLNLSKGAYLWSKIVIMLLISAIQSFLFVGLGNWIMGFSELYFEYWLMLFAMSLYANALGLNISSAFKSAVTIYILIPFLIIPQLLLSGILVKFDELNPIMAARSVVPVPGEVMGTRWALEGLMVELFKENGYEKNFYEIEKAKEEMNYRRVFWFNEMKTLIEEAKAGDEAAFSLMVSEFGRVGEEGITKNLLEDGTANQRLDALRSAFSKQYQKEEEKLDQAFEQVANGVDPDAYWSEQKSLYFNGRLADLVLNKDEIADRIYEEKAALHSGQNAVYMDPPEGQFLRAHFYAPRKFLFGNYYDTYWVNVMVILAMTILFYVALYFELLERGVHYLEQLSHRRKGQ